MIGKVQISCSSSADSARPPGGMAEAKNRETCGENLDGSSGESSTPNAISVTSSSFQGCRKRVGDNSQVPNERNENTVRSKHSKGGQNQGGLQAGRRNLSRRCRRTSYRAPRRFKTAFNFFQLEALQQMWDVDTPRENRASENEQLCRLVGKQWREMKMDQKKPFLEMAEKDKERYRRECEELRREVSKRTRRAASVSRAKSMQQQKDPFGKGPSPPSGTSSKKSGASTNPHHANQHGGKKRQRKRANTKTSNSHTSSGSSSSQLHSIQQASKRHPHASQLSSHSQLTGGLISSKRSIRINQTGGPHTGGKAEAPANSSNLGIGHKPKSTKTKDSSDTSSYDASSTRSSNGSGSSLVEADVGSSAEKKRRKRQRKEKQKDFDGERKGKSTNSGSSQSSGRRRQQTKGMIDKKESEAAHGNDIVAPTNNKLENVFQDAFEPLATNNIEWEEEEEQKLGKTLQCSSSESQWEEDTETSSQLMLGMPGWEKNDSSSIQIDDFLTSLGDEEAGNGGTLRKSPSLTRSSGMGRSPNSRDRGGFKPASPLKTIHRGKNAAPPSPSISDFLKSASDGSPSITGVKKERKTKRSTSRGRKRDSTDNAPGGIKDERRVRGGKRGAKNGTSSTLGTSGTLLEEKSPPGYEASNQVGGNGSGGFDLSWFLMNNQDSSVSPPPLSPGLRTGKEGSLSTSDNAVSAEEIDSALLSIPKLPPSQRSTLHRPATTKGALNTKGRATERRKRQRDGIPRIGGAEGTRIDQASEHYTTGIDQGPREQQDKQQLTARQTRRQTLPQTERLQQLQQAGRLGLNSLLRYQQNQQQLQQHSVGRQNQGSVWTGAASSGHSKHNQAGYPKPRQKSGPNGVGGLGVETGTVIGEVYANLGSSTETSSTTSMSTNTTISLPTQNHGVHAASLYQGQRSRTQVPSAMQIHQARSSATKPGVPAITLIHTQTPHSMFFAGQALQRQQQQHGRNGLRAYEQGNGITRRVQASLPQGYNPWSQLQQVGQEIPRASASGQVRRGQGQMQSNSQVVQPPQSRTSARQQQQPHARLPRHAVAGTFVFPTSAVVLSTSAERGATGAAMSGSGAAPSASAIRVMHANQVSRPPDKEFKDSASEAVNLCDWVMGGPSSGGDLSNPGVGSGDNNQSGRSHSNQGTAAALNFPGIPGSGKIPTLLGSNNTGNVAVLRGLQVPVQFGMPGFATYKGTDHRRHNLPSA